MSGYGVPGGVRLLTVREFERLPEDGFRSELVRGRLVREPPPGAAHGGITAGLAGRLTAFVGAHRLGRVVVDTGFVLAEEPATVRAPDIAFLGEARIGPAGLPAGYVPGAPDLAVEVVSASEALGAIREKVRDYLTAGARVVWVVDPRTRTIAVHRPDGHVRTLGVGGVLEGGAVLPGLRLGVAEVFGG